jgi:hypothetical protein
MKGHPRIRIVKQAGNNAGRLTIQEIASAPVSVKPEDDAVEDVFRSSFKQSKQEQRHAEK